MLTSQVGLFPANSSGRIEAVLDWATVRGMRTGENPARRARLAPVEHHPALAYAEVPRFLADLRRQPGIAARALEFAILTAARTGEVIGAKWDEVEGEAWTIPGSRMKASREHRVPCRRACPPSQARLKLRQQVQHLCPDREGLLRWEDDTGT